MLFKLLPNATLVKPVQPEKVSKLMLVTLLGMVTLVKPVQPEKALSPMLVTLLGIIVVLQPDIRVLVAVSIMALQLSRLSYLVLPDSTLMFVKLVQPEKALYPMLVTLLGMVMLVNPVQS